MNDWSPLITTEEAKPYFTKLKAFLSEESNSKTIYPPKKQVYHAFSLTPYHKTTVVLLGQDPYHGPHQAHGLSFSVASDQAKFPPSLRNIFKELESDLGIHRTNPNLTDWAEQGVLLLNTVLTVEAGKAASHRGLGWETFTDRVIAQLNDREDPLVFILWGKAAQGKSTLLTNPIHKTIQSVHPSPLSAHGGFFGSKPFSTVNRWLAEANKPEVRW